MQSDYQVSPGSGLSERVKKKWLSPAQACYKTRNPINPQMRRFSYWRLRQIVACHVQSSVLADGGDQFFIFAVRAVTFNNYPGRKYG
jgi:hypothetical protein